MQSSTARTRNPGTETRSHPLTDDARARILALVAELLDAILPALAAPARPDPAPTPTAAPAPLVDKREIARLLRVSIATVDRHDREGQPHLYIGDVKRYDASAVMAWHRERSAQVSARAAPSALPSSSSSEEHDPLRVSGVRLLTRAKVRRRG